MKRIILLLTVIFSVTTAKSQFVYKIKADSVLITNDSCTAELIIENSTKNVKGFLVNKGNGRTEFRRAEQLTDSSFVIAGDTIIMQSNSGTTLYSGNGTLASDRVVSMGSYTLNFNGNNTIFSSDGGNDIPQISLIDSYLGDNTQMDIKVDAISGGVFFRNTNDLNYTFDGLVGASGFVSDGYGIFETYVNAPVLQGSQNAGDNLTIRSNSNSTKGKIFIGTSGYDEVNNRLGVGTNSPSAALHLKAGTTTANTAPLKFTSGTNLTTPEAGAVEFDGANYFVTSSTTRYILAKTLTGTATLDFGSTAAGAKTDLTITVNGAGDGDVVSVGVPNNSITSNGSFSAWVSASNTVTVRFTNNDLSTSYDPASGTFRISVLKY